MRLRSFALLSLFVIIARPSNAQSLRLQGGIGKAGFTFSDVENYRQNTSFNIGVFREKFLNNNNRASFRTGIVYRHLQATSGEKTERGIEQYRYDNIELQGVLSGDLRLLSADPFFCLGADAGVNLAVPLAASGSRTGPSSAGSPVRAWDKKYERPFITIGFIGALHASLRINSELQLKLTYSAMIPFSPISRTAPENTTGTSTLPSDEYNTVTLTDRSYDLGVVFKLKKNKQRK